MGMKSNLPKKAHFFVGIDPGKTGAVAAIDADMNLYLAKKMPIITKKELDVYQLKHWFDELTEKNAYCIIEKASARPGQGVSSMFSYGSTYGSLLALVATSGMPFETVAPATWKKHMALSSDKDQSVVLAVSLFPAFREMYRDKKLDHNIAEAILLAEYAHRKYNGLNIPK